MSPFHKKWSNVQCVLKRFFMVWWLDHKSMGSPNGPPCYMVHGGGVIDVGARAAHFSFRQPWSKIEDHGEKEKRKLLNQ